MNTNNDLLFDYITGNEIDQEILEKLEDNEKFMMAVLKLTNDKKMYMHCSDNLKTKYSFVKFLIEKFNKDIDFVISVSEEFITRGKPTHIENLEIVVMLSNLYDKTKNDDLVGYKFQASVEYEGFIREINKFIDKNENEEDEYDLGFVFIIDNFEGHPIIMDMFAKNMIDECIYDTEYSLEKVAHGTFETYEQLEEYGTKNFILDYLGSIDYCLKGYVRNNLHLIEPIEKKLKSIKNNWDCFEENLLINQIEFAFREFYNYSEEHNINYMDLMHEFGKIISNMNLLEIFEKNAPLEMELIKESLNDGFDDELDDITRHNFIKHMTCYIEELFSKTNLEYEEDYYEEDEAEKIKPKIKTKIINYDFSKKKVISITE